MIKCSPAHLRRLAVRSLVALASVVAGVSAVGVNGASAAAQPAAVKSAVPSAVVPAAVGDFGYSYCYYYSYTSTFGTNYEYAYQYNYAYTWAQTFNFASQAGSKFNGGSYQYEWFYAWVYGNLGSANCSRSVSFIDYDVARTGTIQTVTGRVSTPGAVETLSDPEGNTICIATAATTAGASGGFPFTCSGPFDRPAGTYLLTLKASRPGFNDVTAKIPVTIAGAPVAVPTALTSVTVNPNPTSGPATVSGRVNKPSAVIVVKNQDGTTLCTTTAAAVAVSGTYPWSCGGTVSGPAGDKVLTVTATDVDGRTGAETVPVTKTGNPTTAPLGIKSVIATPNPTTGPLTISGTTNRPNAKIQVKDPNGTVICTTTGAATSANGLYSWACSGTLAGPAGVKILTVKATGPNGNSVSTTIPVEKKDGTPTGSALAVYDVNAVRNLNGTVTVSGTTNRPGAKIVVTAADGSVLCSTTGSTTAVGNRYPWSCTGSCSVAAQVATVTVTGPNGNKVRTTVNIPAMNY